mmetsp:Transcript_34745/g.34399  ORF Transcript_34745/g.34399 Transcript_34745/m.34399 type:complete len:116 (-) Transcript_34745:666-1013(-)
MLKGQCMLATSMYLKMRREKTLLTSTQKKIFFISVIEVLISTPESTGQDSSTLIKIKLNKTGVSKDAFNAFLEIVKCPVCLEVMDDPVNVKTCLHKFCNKCIEKYIRVKKKECPT